MNTPALDVYAKEATKRQEEIRDLSEELAIKVVKYLFDAASSGHTTPVPPRPKREILETVNYAARTLDAFNASGGFFPHPQP